jgi:hypothetical protein
MASVTAPLERLREAADRLVVDGRSEGIEPDGPLGLWLEGQAAALRALGEIIDGQTARIEGLLQSLSAAADSELEKAAAITKQAKLALEAGQVALHQARNAQITLAVEQENVVARMIKETLPLFIKEMKGTLIIREKQHNDGVRRRRFAVAGAVTLGVFLGGYALSWWQGADAYDGMQRCLAHPLQAQGHLYCDITNFGARIP